MGLVQALRALVDQLDGALSDYAVYSDEADVAARTHAEHGGRDDRDEVYHNEPLVAGRAPRERGPRSLAVVCPPHYEVLVVMPMSSLTHSGSPIVCGPGVPSSSSWEAVCGSSRCA